MWFFMSCLEIQFTTHLASYFLFYKHFFTFYIWIYIPIFVAPSIIKNCTHGQLRLVDGPNIRQGRLEICINEAWGAVCSSGFFDEDASVACAQMNFDREGMSTLLVYILSLS